MLQNRRQVMQCLDIIKGEDQPGFYYIIFVLIRSRKYTCPGKKKKQTNLINCEIMTNKLIKYRVCSGHRYIHFELNYLVKNIFYMRRFYFIFIFFFSNLILWLICDVILIICVEWYTSSKLCL